MDAPFPTCITSCIYWLQLLRCSSLLHLQPLLRPADGRVQGDPWRNSLGGIPQLGFLHAGRWVGCAGIVRSQPELPSLRIRSMRDFSFLPAGPLATESIIRLGSRGTIFLGGFLACSGFVGSSLAPNL